MKSNEAVTPRTQMHCKTLLHSFLSISELIYRNSYVPWCLLPYSWFPMVLFSYPSSSSLPIPQRGVLFFPLAISHLCLSYYLPPYTTSRSYSLIPGPRVGIQTNQHPSVLLSTYTLPLALASLYPQSCRHAHFIFPNPTHTY